MIIARNEDEPRSRRNALEPRLCLNLWQKRTGSHVTRQPPEQLDCYRGVPLSKSLSLLHFDYGRTRTIILETDR